MKKTAALVMILALCGGLLAQTTRGTISSSETWSSNVSLRGDVTVSGGTLTINPGVTVTGNGYYLKLKGAGIVKAVGTATGRIVFNDAQIIVEALTNDEDCFFQYCDFKNGYNVMEFRNPSGVTELSSLRIDNCLFQNGSYCLLYVTSGGSPKISNCHFVDASSGIFVHGGDTVDVSNTSFTDVSQGIISGGLGSTEQSWEPMLLEVNHCVFYDIDDTRSVSGVPVSKGYAICSINYPGTMIIKDNIFHTITNSSIRDWNIEDDNFPVNWTVENDYNCHYNLGAEPFRLRDPGANSIEVNPQMTNPAGGDYSLETGSPCAGTGTSGSDMGIYEESSIRDLLAGTPQLAEKVKLCNNPMKDDLVIMFTRPATRTIGIYSQEGQLVKSLQEPTNRAVWTWDGRDGNGTAAPQGRYFAVITTPEGVGVYQVQKQ